MNGLGAELSEYLAVRRALGYQLTETERQLNMFVAHLDDNGIGMVTVDVAVAWATATPRGGPGFRRLTMVRGFARYLQALDPIHEVPPTGMLPARTARRVPHLYSDTDIATLMAATGDLDPPAWAATVHTMIGLFWATGLRPSELLRLNTADFDLDAGSITVWHSKFNKSRLVPLHPTTTAALARYRDGVDATTARRQRRCSSESTASASAISGSTPRSSHWSTRPGSARPMGAGHGFTTSATASLSEQ